MYSSLSKETVQKKNSQNSPANKQSIRFIKYIVHGAIRYPTRKERNRRDARREFGHGSLPGRRVRSERPDPTSPCRGARIPCVSRPSRDVYGWYADRKSNSALCHIDTLFFFFFQHCGAGSPTGPPTRAERCVTSTQAEAASHVACCATCSVLLCPLLAWWYHRQPTQYTIKILHMYSERSVELPTRCCYYLLTLIHRTAILVFVDIVIRIYNKHACIRYD